MTKKEVVENFLMHPGINRSHFARASHIPPTSLSQRLDKISGLLDWQVNDVAEQILKFLDEIHVTEITDDAH